MSTAFQLLWDPRGASGRASRASLLLPLILLAVGNALPNYALLIPMGAAGLADTKVQSTPDGMYAASVLFFMGLTWLSPLVLPARILVTGWLMDYYVGFVLDTRTRRSELLRLAAWGALPIALERLLSGIIVLACGRVCNLFNPLAANAAFFLDAKETPIFWYEMARGLDAFAGWSIWVTATALAARYQRSAGAITCALAFLWFAAIATRAWLLG
jgi:hypothetical protein